MKVFPILICRTKYIDYQNPVFCAPKALSPIIAKNLHDDIVRGNNIKRDGGECKILISDRHQIVIGKVLVIQKKFSDKFDTSFDKETGGRNAWGFIGGVISCDEYIKENSILDLPESYYEQAYKECLYDSHWLEDTFTGPYNSECIDVEMVSLQNANSSFEVGSVPIFSDSMNKEVFVYAIKQILKGEMVAYCSNAEYNAAQAINSGILTLATVSSNLLQTHIDTYKKYQQNQKQKQEQKRKQNQQDKGTEPKFKDRFDYKNITNTSFVNELSLLCKKYGYVCQSNKEYSDVMLITKKGKKSCIIQFANWLIRFYSYYNNDRDD